MKLIRLILMLMLLVPFHAEASITEGGSGMLFGNDHAFNFTAPNGWVLDNQSGVQQGMHMVFYPVGQTWENSPVIAYGMSVAKDSVLRTIDDQVKSTVDDFRSNGSNDYMADAKEEIKIPGGKTAKVYFFHGDQWGNYEAVGYIEEKETINFLVYNSRNKTDFEKNLPAFKSILTSYKNSYGQPTSGKDSVKFDMLVREAKTFESTKEGSEYIAKFFRAYGNSLADIMKSCTAYTTKGKEATFELLFHIKPDGTVSETLIRPENTLTTCVRGLAQDSHHPPHQFQSVPVYIDMSVKE